MTAAFATIGVFVLGLVVVGAYLSATTPNRKEKGRSEEKPHHA